MKKLLAILLFLLIPTSSAFAALAFDAESTSGATYWQGSSVSSVTQSHTVGAGSNRILICTVVNYSVVTTTSATYNGVAMTLVDRSTGSVESLSQDTTMWQLVAPATGANNFVATLSGSSTYHSISCMSYNGVDQSNPIDSHTNSTGASATSFTQSTTVVASNAWLVGVAFSRDTSGSAGAGTTLRGYNSSSLVSGADSNGTVGTGSQSLVWNSSSAGTWPGGIIASLKPFVTASTPSPSQEIISFDE